MIARMAITILGFVFLLSAQPRDNMSIIQQNLSVPIISALDSIPAASGTPNIYLQFVPGTGSLDWFSSQLSAGLLKKGYHITGNKSIADIIVKLNQLSTHIEYHPRKNLPFRAAKMKRVIEGSINTEFFNGEDILVSVKHVNYKHEDIILKKQITTLENKSYPFSIGTKKESVLIRRLVEPVFVSTATIAVIYLLYTLRSGS